MNFMNLNFVSIRSSVSSLLYFQWIL